MQRNVIKEVRVITSLVNTFKDHASTENEKVVASKKIAVFCHKLLTKLNFGETVERNHLAFSLVELFKTKSTYFPLGNMWSATMNSFLVVIDDIGLSYRKTTKGNKLYIELI